MDLVSFTIPRKVAMKESSLKDFDKVLENKSFQKEIYMKVFG